MSASKALLTDEQLKTALQQHTQWLINPSLGKRLDLQGANLQGANFQCANIQRANFWGADLQGTNLHDANIQGAILQDANLQDVIGDGTIIRSAQFEGQVVVSCDDLLQIGCEGHRVHEWLEFTDYDISVMDCDALTLYWWKKYRAAILAFCDF